MPNLWENELFWKKGFLDQWQFRISQSAANVNIKTVSDQNQIP